MNTKHYVGTTMNDRCQQNLQTNWNDFVLKIKEIHVYLCQLFKVYT